MLFSARLDTAMAILDDLSAHFWAIDACARVVSHGIKLGHDMAHRPMKRLLLIAGVLALVLIAGAAAWVVWTLRPERVRNHLITAVSDRFASRVDVDAAMVSIYPRPAITGSRLRIQMRNADPELPPLVSVSAFQASAPFSGLIGPRVRLGNVSLVGTDIRIPPGGVKPAVASLDTANPTAVAPRRPYIHRD